MINKNLEQHSRHTATYRQRRKDGFTPTSKPWDWLTLADVQKLAVEAYLVASWFAKPDMEDSALTPQEQRDFFAQGLSAMFNDAVMARASSQGKCFPANDYSKVWETFLAEVPTDWRPQYPVYQKVMPASSAGTPGIVTNVDEGNVNERNSKP